MSTPATDDAAAAPPKGKKKLLVIVAAVLVLALGGGGAFIYMKKKAEAEAEEGDEAPVAAAKAPEHKGPPAYMPLDNMVVNLADPGGERVAQIGVTLELNEEHDIEHVKAYLPTIKSEVLLLISQRTADELLSREGKDKLSEDIMETVSKHFVSEEGGKKKKKGKEEVNPVRGVLYGSFIIQ